MSVFAATCEHYLCAALPDDPIDQYDASTPYCPGCFEAQGAANVDASQDDLVAELKALYIGATSTGNVLGDAKTADDLMSFFEQVFHGETEQDMYESPYDQPQHAATPPRSPQSPQSSVFSYWDLPVLNSSRSTDHGRHQHVHYVPSSQSMSRYPPWLSSVPSLSPPTSPLSSRSYTFSESQSPPASPEYHARPRQCLQTDMEFPRVLPGHGIVISETRSEPSSPLCSPEFELSRESFLQSMEVLWLDYQKQYQGNGADL